MIFRRKFISVMLLVSLAILFSAAVGIVVFEYRVDHVKKETARVSRDMFRSLIEMKSNQVVGDFDEHLRGKTLKEQKKTIRELLVPEPGHHPDDIFDSVFSEKDNSIMYSYSDDSSITAPQGPDINRDIALAKRGGGFEEYVVNGSPWILYVTPIKNTPYVYAVNINVSKFEENFRKIFDPTFSFFRSIAFSMVGGSIILVLSIHVLSLPVFRRVVILEKEIFRKREKLSELNNMLNVEVELRKTIEDELKKIAITDELSGLANRRMFDKTLKKEWDRHLRNQKQISLLVCDIDFFKKYNDTYGHQKGDEAITAVASAIGSVCRRPGDLAARYGGEEFVVILPETEKSGARIVAEEVIENVRNLGIENKSSSVDRNITLSVGVSSVVPQQGVSHETLFKTADAALYRAKELGRNRVVVSED